MRELHVSVALRCGDYPGVPLVGANSDYDKLIALAANTLGILEDQHVRARMLHAVECPCQMGIPDSSGPAPGDVEPELHALPDEIDPQVTATISNARRNRRRINNGTSA